MTEKINYWYIIAFFTFIPVIPLLAFGFWNADMVQLGAGFILLFVSIITLQIAIHTNKKPTRTEAK